VRFSELWWSFLHNTGTEEAYANIPVSGIITIFCSEIPFVTLIRPPLKEIITRIEITRRNRIRYPVLLVVPFTKHSHATQGTATYDVAICYRLDPDKAVAVLRSENSVWGSWKGYITKTCNFCGGFLIADLFVLLPVGLLTNPATIIH